MAVRMAKLSNLTISWKAKAAAMPWRFAAPRRTAAVGMIGAFFLLACADSGTTIHDATRELRFAAVKRYLRKGQAPDE